MGHRGIDFSDLKKPIVYRDSDVSNNCNDPVGQSECSDWPTQKMEQLKKCS